VTEYLNSFEQYPWTFGIEEMIEYQNTLEDL